jgi:hypothetical protein
LGKAAAFKKLAGLVQEIVAHPATQICEKDFR